MTLLDDLTELADRWQGDHHASQLRHIIRRHTSPLTEDQQRTLLELANGATQAELMAAHELTKPGANWRVGRIHAAYRTRSTTRAVVEAIRAGHLDLNDVEGKWEGNEPTPGQVRILQAVADHGTNAEAAAHLNLTPSAVATALHKCSWEAGTGSRVQIVVRAIREGWIW